MQLNSPFNPLLYRAIGVSIALLFAAAPGRTFAVEIFSSGHGDVGVAYEDGDLELELHLDDVGEAFEPGGAVIRLPIATAERRRAGAAFDGIGVAAGSTIYRLSQSAVEAAQQASPFLGIATEEIPPHTFALFPGTDPLAGIGLIRIELVVADGPGHFSLWQDIGGVPGFETRPDLIGMALASADGIDPAHDYIDMPTGLHTHANWAFTAPGEYQITLRASGELLTGELLENVGTFSFHVTPEPGTSAMAAVGLTTIGGLSWRSRRRKAASTLRKTT